MDKTRNKIFVGCLALLLVMVAGYALFSQNLNITGTAKAEGNFSVTMTCTPGLTNEGFLNANLLGYEPTRDNNYINDSCSVNGNKVTYQAELKMPGAVRNFTIKMTNSGSMDAVLNVNDGKLSSKICTGNYDTGEFGECVDGSTVNNNITTGSIVGFGKTDGTILLATYGNLDEVKKFFNFDDEKITIKPGESVYYVLKNSWRKDLIEQTNKVLYKEIITIELPFKQLTAK